MKKNLIDNFLISIFGQILVYIVIITLCCFISAKLHDFITWNWFVILSPLFIFGIILLGIKLYEHILNNLSKH